MEAVAADDSGAEELDALNESELNEVTFSLTESFRGIATARKNWVLDKASNAEWTLTRLAYAIDGADPSPPRDQNQDTNAEIAQADSLQAEVVIDVEDADDDAVAFLMEASERLEASVMNDLESAFEKSSVVSTE